MNQLCNNVRTSMHHVTDGYSKTGFFRQVKFNLATQWDKTTAFTLPDALTKTDITARISLKTALVHHHHNIIALVCLQPDTMGCFYVVWQT